MVARLEFLILLAAVAPAAATGGDAFDFNGYLRAGTTRSREAGQEGCFQLAGAATKFRLGNECDYYGEFMLSGDAWRGSGGTTVRAHLMLNVWKPEIGGSPLSARDFNFNQAYLEGRPIPQLGNAKVWAGRRFYKRRGVHIIDYFYNDPTGTGAGIEDYALAGIVNISYAYMGNGGAGDVVAAPRHNLQFTGFRLYEGGTLDFAVNRVGRNSHAASAEAVHSGTGLMLEWQHKLGSAAINRLSYSVGRGAAASANYGGAGDPTADGSTRRAMLMNHIDFQLTASVGGQFVALREIQSHPLPATNSTWTSIGGRLTYAFTDNVKLIGELGNDRVTPAAGPPRQLTKLTLAPALALKRNFWSRPELRFYYTYARWNTAAQEAAAFGAALSSAGAYGAVTHGHKAGMQIEAWW